MWFLLFLVVVLALSALAFRLYHGAVCRYEQRVIEEHEEAQREQRRQANYVPTPEQPPAGDWELEGISAEEYQAGCAEALAQLAQRRKAQRRWERRVRR
ncbi:MAG: hypothetical protein JO250_23115 [Armatimonadetes bacterium]|nr:hypothetical protein [Armatimonadota bacterium]